jgi:hypothetical protein
VSSTGSPIALPCDGAQVAQVSDAGMAGLDRQDDPLDLAVGRLIMEIQAA